MKVTALHKKKWVLQRLWRGGGCTRPLRSDFHALWRWEEEQSGAEKDNYRDHRAAKENATTVALINPEQLLTLIENCSALEVML